VPPDEEKAAVVGRKRSGIPLAKKILGTEPHISGSCYGYLPATELPTLSKSKKRSARRCDRVYPPFPGDAFASSSKYLNQKLPVVPCSGKTEEWALPISRKPNEKRTVAIPVTLFWVAAAINPRVVHSNYN